MSVDLAQIPIQHARSTCVHDLMAKQVMTAPVVAVQSHDTFWHAWELLSRTGLRHLVVMEDRRCVGVLDERYVLRECCTTHVVPERRQIRETMTGTVHAVLDDAPVSEVARTMLRYGLDVVAVLTEHGAVSGVITAGNLVSLLAGRVGPEAEGLPHAG